MLEQFLEDLHITPTGPPPVAAFPVVEPKGEEEGPAPKFVLKNQARLHWMRRQVSKLQQAISGRRDAVVEEITERIEKAPSLSDITESHCSFTTAVHGSRFSCLADISDCGSIITSAHDVEEEGTNAPAEKEGKERKPKRPGCKRPKNKNASRKHWRNTEEPDEPAEPEFVMEHEIVSPPKDVPIMPMKARIEVEKELLAFLRAEAMFMPRKPALLRQLKLKAKQFWRGYSTSDYTLSEITAITTMTIGAAMVPSEEELLAYRFMCQRDSVEAVHRWNAFIESGQPRTIFMGLIQKARNLAYQNNYTIVAAFMVAMLKLRYNIHNNPVVEYIKAQLGQNNTEVAARALRWFSECHTALTVLGAAMGGFVHF